jgi:hypothetical protein
MAAKVDGELQDRLLALGLVAAAITPTMIEHPTALQTFLEQHFVLGSLFNAGIIAYRPDGTVIADVPLSGGRSGVNFIDRDAVVAALNEGRPAIGKPSPCQEERKSRVRHGCAHSRCAGQGDRCAGAGRSTSASPIFWTGLAKAATARRATTCSKTPRTGW